MSTGRFFFTSEILNIFAWNWKLIEQKYLGLQWHFWVSNFWTFVTSEDICQFKLQQQSRYQTQLQTFTEETYLPLNIKILCNGVCGMWQGMPESWCQEYLREAVHKSWSRSDCTMATNISWSTLNRQHSV